MKKQLAVLSVLVLTWGASMQQAGAQDANQDGLANIQDLAIVATNWDPLATNLTWSDGDFDGDGDVDAMDLGWLGLGYTGGWLGPTDNPPARMWARHDGGMPAGLPDHTSYTVYLLSSNPAYPVGAWECSFDGPMNQEYVSGVVPTPTMNMADLLGASALNDSHLLLYDEQLLTLTAPSETPTNLSGGLNALRAPYRDVVLPFARIVVADGDVVRFTGMVADAYGGSAFPVFLEMPGVQEAMAGDTDCDGDIDAVDLATLGLNWDPAGHAINDWLDGDFDLNGKIDATDLAYIGINWGPAGYPVPEPATLSLLALGAVASACMRRRA